MSLNRDKKRLDSLMFVDLQEAYDRVDRGILSIPQGLLLWRLCSDGCSGGKVDLAVPE